MTEMDEDFKIFLNSKGITDTQYNDGSLEAKAKLVEAFENSKARHTDDDDEKYNKFPLYFDILKMVGMHTPYEQYALYISVGVTLYASYSPVRKAFFMNKWLHETDESLKDIWAARANLTIAEQKGGIRYLEELKRVPRRIAVLPVSFLLIVGYRKVSNYFNTK